MDYVILAQVPQSNQQLNGKSTHKALRNSLEIIELYKFIQVHGEHLERQDQVLAENKTVEKSDDVTFVVGILLVQALENASFDQPLFIKTLFVPQDFECDHLPCLMVQALEDLTEGAFTNVFLDLVSVADVILGLTYVLTFIIVESAVLWPVWSLQSFAATGRAPLLSIYVVDLIILHNFCFFVVKKALLEVDQALARLHRELLLLSLAIHL